MEVRTFLPLAALANGKPAIAQLTRYGLDYTARGAAHALRGNQLVELVFGRGWGRLVFSLYRISSPGSSPTTT